MQDGIRINATSQIDLYNKVSAFRAANGIMIGNLISDVDSFLASLFMRNPSSIPPFGWNYMQGSKMIVADTHEGIYKAVADYRIANAITLGDYQGDIEAYYVSLPDFVWQCLKNYRRYNTCG